MELHSTAVISASEVKILLGLDLMEDLGGGRTAGLGLNGEATLLIGSTGVGEGMTTSGVLGLGSGGGLVKGAVFLNVNRGLEGITTLGSSIIGGKVGVTGLGEDLGATIRTGLVGDKAGNSLKLRSETTLTAGENTLDGARIGIGDLALGVGEGRGV